MICRSCGKELSAEAKFCEYCGAKTAAEGKTCPACGRVCTSGAVFCRYCGADFRKAASSSEPAAEAASQAASAAAKPTAKPKKKGRRLIALLLAAVLAFVGIKAWKGRSVGDPEDDFIMSELSAKDDTEAVRIDYTPTSETAALSSETLSARLSESGVGVTLTQWVLDEGREEQLSVTSIEPVYDPEGDYVIKPYEVSLGDIHELTDFIEIRIPYDTTFCEAGQDPAECVGGVYYNEETGEWEEVLYTVDAEAGEIVIETDHFSKFGAITLKNKGRRDAMLCMAKEKVDASFDIGYLDEEQTVQVLRQLCDTEELENETAKLAGTQVLGQAMNLGGSSKTVLDGVGAAFNFAYYLDLSDVAMAGRFTDTKPMFWVQGIPIGTMVDTSVSYSNSSFYTYSSEMVNEAGKFLSRVGNAVSACKLVYLAAKAGSGSAEDSEIWDLYKESASMAVSLAGGTTLSALMAPVFLADTFISSIYEEGMAIKESQIEEMFLYFNTDYPGCSYPAVRAGRSLKDWRDVIIKLIDENPEADTAELLKKEIDTFANEFWTLNSDQMADVVAQMPQTIKRITVDDQRIRTKITNGYKKELYDQLTPVLTSVRNYYSKKLVLKTQQQIAAAIKFYNQTITFDIVEEDPETEVLYGGCKCVFGPLYENAEAGNWISTLPESGRGLHGEMTLIGHITSGSPTHLLVFDKDADMQEDEPLLTVPFEIDGNNHIQIILSGGEKQDDTGLVYALDTTVYTAHYEDQSLIYYSDPNAALIPPGEDDTDPFSDDTITVGTTILAKDISLTEGEILRRMELADGSVSEDTVAYPGNLVSDPSEFNAIKGRTVFVYTTDSPDRQTVISGYNTISSCVGTLKQGDTVCIVIDDFDLALKYVCMPAAEAQGHGVTHIDGSGWDYAENGEWK